MKKMIWRRIQAFLLAVSMMICMFGASCRAEASETDGQTDETKQLSIPQNVCEENGFVVWDEVEGAYGYTIQAEKGGETWTYNWYENKIEWNRFIYEQCNWGDFGDYTFRVCAFDEAMTPTEFSAPVTLSYQATFPMPENAHVLESDARNLIWDEVEGAARYNIKVYINDESQPLQRTEYTTYPSFYLWENEGEYLVSVQTMDQDYHVSEWTEKILMKVAERPRLAAPQNVRFDESGNNIIWDEVEGADYYYVDTGFGYHTHCEQPMLENWKRYISPWSWTSLNEGKQYIEVYAGSNSDIETSDWSEYLEFEYTPTRDESITVPQIKLEDDHITWDETENAFRYICRIAKNGDVYDCYSYEKEYGRTFWISGYPEGDYEIELCVIDEDGNYNSKSYPLTLNTAHDESIWIPKLYHKFETVLWDYDRLRHPDTSNFWVRIRKQRDGTVVKLMRQYSEYFYGLMDLGNGDYTLDACVQEYSNQLGNWSEPMNIEKHGEGLYEKENETTAEVETPPEDISIPEEDRITSITINPAFNMKHKDGDDVELDLSKIKIKAKEIYDEEGLKRAEAALGETLKGNKHYNLLDLTLLYNGEDFSNGYEGLVKVIIPLPKGHRDKTFSCYRLTEADGKVTKEIIPGEQTEDSYIIYLEHFSEYALVGAGPEEPEETVKPVQTAKPTETVKPTQTAKPIETVKPIQTAKPAETVKPIQTIEPVETVKPTQTVKPAETVKPIQTIEPAETVKPVQTVKPAETEKPVQTIKPTETVKPPAETAKPIQTIMPAETKEPVNEKPPATTKLTKKQKKKNGIILNKKASSKITDNFSLTVAWNKLPDADGYDIYAAFCGNDFAEVTASVGKNKTSATIRQLKAGKIGKIDRMMPYKVKVEAYRLSDGKKQYIGSSAVMHVVGSLSKKLTNAKSISVKKKAYSLEKGKSAQIRAAIKKADKKKKLLSEGHGPTLVYTSSDEAIATVTRAGKIKAKNPGQCIIYVRALNGISKEIKVTVNE